MFRVLLLSIGLLIAPIASSVASAGEGTKVIHLLYKVAGDRAPGGVSPGNSAECVLISMATPESKAALTIGRRIRDTVLEEMKILGIERIFTEETIQNAADQKLKSGLSEQERAAVLSAEEHLLLLLERDPDALGAFLGKLLREHVRVLDAGSTQGIVEYIATIRKYPEPDQRLILIEGRRKIVESFLFDGNIEMTKQSSKLFLGGILTAEVVYAHWNQRPLFDREQLSEMSDEALQFEAAQIEVISWLLEELTEAYPTQPRDLIDSYWSQHLAESILFQLELDRRGLR